MEDSDDEEVPRPGNPSTLDMRSYMDLMDRELAGTDVGLSFEREPPARPPRRRPAQASDRSVRCHGSRPVTVPGKCLRTARCSHASEVNPKWQRVKPKCHTVGASCTGRRSNRSVYRRHVPGSAVRYWCRLEPPYVAALVASVALRFSRATSRHQWSSVVPWQPAKQAQFLR